MTPRWLVNLGLGATVLLLSANTALILGAYVWALEFKQPEPLLVVLALLGAGFCVLGKRHLREQVEAERRAFVFFLQERRGRRMTAHQRITYYFVLNGLWNGLEGYQATTCGLGEQQPDGWYWLLEGMDDGMGPHHSREAAQRDAEDHVEEALRRMGENLTRSQHGEI